MTQQDKTVHKPQVEEFHGERGKKLLKSSVDATAHIKENYRTFKERTAQGEPVIWTCVGVPHTILVNMDILYEDALHYSALCSAKQMSRYYLDRLNAEGYFRDLCRYCTVALGTAFDRKPEIAPWGGIPKLAAVVTIHNDDPEQKIFEIYAREFDVPLYMIDLSYYPSRIAQMEDWWRDTREEDIEVESHRIDQLVEEYQGLIRFLETITGKHFSESAYRLTMERANAQHEYYWKATDLASTTVPCPISATDSFPQMAALWFQGSQWLADHARKYYEEVKERVDNGEGVCPDEKVRLYWGMYIAIWFNLGFYNAWEEKYGTVFLPTPYMPMGGRGIRRELSDPLRAQASARVSQWLDRYPTTANSIKLWQATRYKADGAVFLMAESCKLNYASTLFNTEALEKVGIPSLIICADMVDARDWDDTKMKALVTSFIETLMP